MGQLFSLISAASWGISNIYVLNATENENIDRFTGVIITLLVNNIINVIILGIYFLSSPEIIINMKGMLYFGVAGFLNGFVGRALLFLSISYIGASRAGLFKVTSPMFAILGGIFILRESISGSIWIGIVIVLTGVLMISLETVRNSTIIQANGNKGCINRINISMPKQGIILGLLSGFFLGSGNMFRKLGVIFIPNPFLGVAVGSFTALSAALLFQLINGNFGKFISAVKKMNKYYVMSGFLTSMALYSLFSALKYTSVTVSNSIAASEPLFTILASLILLGKKEVLTIRTFIGASVVIVGIIFLIIY